MARYVFVAGPEVPVNTQATGYVLANWHMTPAGFQWNAPCVDKNTATEVTINGPPVVTGVSLPYCDASGDFNGAIYQA